MWTFLFVVVAVIVTARVSAMSAKRSRDNEERARKERARARSARETELLMKGPGEIWPTEPPDTALHSLGNVAYLIWLLNYEPVYRDYRGQGEDQYPPDWEWRRRFVFLRDHCICQGHGCSAKSNLGANLDCHHIRPISEFGPEEKGIHALSNLVTLCSICHASQHPGNMMMSGRATKSWTRVQKWLPRSAGQKLSRAPNLKSARRFDRPPELEVHLHDCGRSEQLSDETETQEEVHLGQNNAFSNETLGKKERQVIRKAKSITEGLAIVDLCVSTSQSAEKVEPAGQKDPAYRMARPIPPRYI